MVMSSGPQSEEKIDSTVRPGFVNVIDGFHVVHAKEIPIRFLYDECKSPQPGIRLTEEILVKSTTSSPKSGTVC